MNRALISTGGTLSLWNSSRPASLSLLTSFVVYSHSSVVFNARKFGFRDPKSLSLLLRSWNSMVHLKVSSRLNILKKLEQVLYEIVNLSREANAKFLLPRDLL